MNATAQIQEVLEFLYSGKYEVVVEVILGLYELLVPGEERPCTLVWT